MLYSDCTDSECWSAEAEKDYEYMWKEGRKKQKGNRENKNKEE
jgi:hypothetical protein